MAIKKSVNNTSKKSVSKKSTSPMSKSKSNVASSAVTSSGPSYKELITEALVELKTRKGVSRPALKKFIQNKYKLKTDSFDRFFNLAVRKGVENGIFVQPNGPSGTLKLNKVEKEKSPVSKPKVSKTAPKSKVSKTVSKAKTKAGSKKVTKKSSAVTSSGAKALSYKDMIIKSVLELNEGKGSSRIALKKFIKTEYAKKINEAKNFDYLFNSAIKKGVESGLLAQPKGPSGVVKVLKKGKMSLTA